MLRPLPRTLVAALLTLVLACLASGRAPAMAADDTTRTPVVITSPADGAALPAGDVTFTGTAMGGGQLLVTLDAGGVIGAVDLFTVPDSGVWSRDIPLSVGPAHVLVSYADGGASGADEISVTVGDPPVITRQPTDQFVRSGQTVNWSVLFTGTAPVATLWERSSDGGATWSYAHDQNIWGFAASMAHDGQLYRATLSNAFGSVVSDVAQVRVGNPPEIWQHPTDAFVPEGSSASFTVAASGHELHVQWERSRDGAEWVAVGERSGTSWTLQTDPLQRSQDGELYRAVVSSLWGTQTSEPAVVRVGEAPVITAQPQTTYVASGDAAAFSVAASGSGPLSVRWQWATAAATIWTDATEDSAGSWEFVTSPREAVHDGYRYRAVVSSPFGEVVSEVAVVRVVTQAPTVLLHPQDVAVITPHGASFSAAATTSVGSMTTRWQSSTDDGVTWVDVAGAVDGTYDLLVTDPGMDGTLYRAVFTNLAGESATDPARLTARAVVVAGASLRIDSSVRLVGSLPHSR